MNYWISKMIDIQKILIIEKNKKDVFIKEDFHQNIKEKIIRSVKGKKKE